MFMREFLRDAYRHMEWADAEVWAAVPLDGPPDPRLRLLLVHVHTVQRAFLWMWTAKPLTDAFRTPESFATLDEVRTWAQPLYDELQAFLFLQNDESLAAPFELPWAKLIEPQIGRPASITTIGETCFQVASHSTYHRGQINARLRELGAVPPLVDYIAWVWSGKPTPSWRTVGELSS